MKPKSTSSPPITGIGIDIGTTQIRVAYGQTVVSRDFTSDMFDENFEQIRPEAISEALKSIHAELQLPMHAPATLALSDRTAVLRTLRLPEMTPQQLKANLPGEAEQLIANDANDIYVDGNVLYKMDGEMHVATLIAPKQDVQRFMTICQAGHFWLSAAESRAQSNLRVFRETNPEDGMHLIVDIGSERTTITSLHITDGQLMTVTPRVIPWGGDSITIAISEATGLSFPNAEELKLLVNEHTSSFADIRRRNEEELGSVSSDLRAIRILGDHTRRIADQISSTAHAYRATHELSSSGTLHLAGGGSLLKLLSELPSETKLESGHQLGRHAVAIGAAMRQGRKHA